MGNCPSLVQRALDALIVHAYETAREFFHKVFNTTVENFFVVGIFSSDQVLYRSIRSATAQSFHASWNCAAMMGFSSS